MASGCILRLCCVFLALVPLIRGSKLNVPRVLLPIFRDFSTNFTLEATEGGCYKWTTTRNDVIHLTPLDPNEDQGCSTKVVISTVSREFARNIAVVLAEDVSSRQVLRCDVIVDAISSLTVTTTTRELFMEEAPETFEVHAFDDQENMFSSMEGIEFEWMLEAGPNGDTTVLRFIRFRDSPYETPPHVGELEEEDRRGYVVLLEGVKTGTAKVSVRLPQPEYRHIAGSEVHLSVIANLIVLPADAYIMAGDTITFRVINMNNGRMEEVKLADSQYYFEVENGDLASAHKTTGEVSGIKEGRTKIVLHDKNLLETDIGLKLPSATLNVVAPAYIALTILPHKNWAIVVGDRHEIVADVYEKNHHKLLVGNNARITMEIGEIFNPEERSRNGSWVAGRAAHGGTAAVRATLTSTLHPRLGNYRINPPISATADLFVFPPISLVPSQVVLPWDPLLKPKYEIEVKATGGDGKFLWSSSNHSVGVVTQTGYARTHSCGSFRVAAAMQRNVHIQQFSTIHVLPPTRLEIVKYAAEAEVGTPIRLHLALFAEKKDKEGSVSHEIPFSNCQDLPFGIRSANPSFVQNRTLSDAQLKVANSCGHIVVVSDKVGTSRITVQYSLNGKVLEDSVTVSTFAPLVALFPRDRQVVLAVGSSINLAFGGGPRPVVGRPSAYHRTVASDNNLVASVTDATKSAEQLGDQEAIVLHVLCKKIGNAVATLSVWNSAPVSIAENQRTSSLITVICGKPRSVALQPRIKVADVHSCPMDLSADRVVVQSYSDVELDVEVLDDLGRRFSNVSSLRFGWLIGPSELGELGSKDGVFVRTAVVEGGAEIANGSYQVVVPKSQTGALEVTASILGYKKEVLKGYKISPEWPEFTSEEDRGKEVGPIKTAIRLYLVDDAVVAPNATSIYNHPSNKNLLSVKQGSGHYRLSLTSQTIADVRYVESSRHLEIVPLNEGEVVVSLIDLCLVSRPALIYVRVVSVVSIRPEMDDKIEIGRSIPVTVRLFDGLDNLVAVPDLDMVQLEPELEAPLIRLRRDDQAEAGLGEVRFVAAGVLLGSTKLKFSIGGVSSSALDVQVFPPLKVYPRNVTLIVGSTIQFVSRGGPQPDVNVEYSAGTGSIANIEAGGLGKGLRIGRTRIEARAVAFNPVTGDKMVYSQDAADLEVIAMTGVKIATPLTRFLVGGRVPFWAGGIPEKLSPMVLGSVEPSFRFEWTVDANEIASIQHPFQNTGINYLPEDSVSIRLLGMKPGRTTLRLKVVRPPNGLDRSPTAFSASVELEVFEELRLTSPPEISTRRVLMAPESVLRLRTNFDGIGKLKYSFEPTKKPNSLISVTDEGVLKSGDILGQAAVVITAIDNVGPKQSLTLIVQVKPIRYVLLNPRTSWTVDGSVAAVPSGSEFELVASYHDDLGAEFTAAAPGLVWRSTRAELTRVRNGPDNSTVVVSAEKSGSAVMRARAIGLDRIVDYVVLRIDNARTPFQEQLTTGDIVCLSTPLVARDGQRGSWSSSDPSLVAVDRATGIGQVIGNRAGQIAIGHSLHPAASLQMQVVAANELVVLATDAEAGQLTNAPGASVLRLPVVVRNSRDGEKLSNLLNGEQCKSDLKKSSIVYPHRCHIEFTNTTPSPFGGISYFFAAKPGFNFETGQYTCDLVPTGEHGQRSSTLVSDVAVVAYIPDGGVESKPTTLKFVPAVYVEEELVLGESSLKATLVVTGVDYVLDQVEVTAYDDSIFQVYEPKRPNPTTLTHDVQLIDYHSKLEQTQELMSVVVVSRLTSQRIRVHVDTRNVESLSRPVCRTSQHSPLAAFLYNDEYVLKIVASIACILVIYFVYRCLQPLANTGAVSPRSFVTSSASNRLPQTCASMSPSFVEKIRPIPHSPSRSPIFQTSADRVYGDTSGFFASSPTEFRNNRTRPF